MQRARTSVVALMVALMVVGLVLAPGCSFFRALGSDRFDYRGPFFGVVHSVKEIDKMRGPWAVYRVLVVLDLPFTFTLDVLALPITLLAGLFTLTKEGMQSSSEPSPEPKAHKPAPPKPVPADLADLLTEEPRPLYQAICKSYKLLPNGAARLELVSPRDPGAVVELTSSVIHDKAILALLSHAWRAKIEVIVRVEHSAEGPRLQRIERAWFSQR